MVGGILTVTQLASSALEGDDSALDCEPAPTQTAVEEPEATAEDAGATVEDVETTVEEVEGNEDLELHIETDSQGFSHYHYRKRGWRGWGHRRPRATEQPAPTEEPAEPAPTGEPAPTEPAPTEGCEDGGDGGDGGSSELPAGVVPPGGADGNNNGLEILGRDCTGSGLPLHAGFQQDAAACINAQHGEVSSVENNPSLLITDAPDAVAVGEAFEVTISTRNLVRDRFLGAGAGGYYLESSFLNEEGIQRGHVHIGCQLIDPTVAPDPLDLLNPGNFVAIEDNGGGAGVDNVTVELAPLEEPGEYRCMAWGGDPSHRVPMMQFARQQIAVDTFRVTVS